MGEKIGNLRRVLKLLAGRKEEQDDHKRKEGSIAGLLGRAGAFEYIASEQAG